MESDRWCVAKEDLAGAERALREDGFTILRGAVAPSLLERLREVMETESRRILESSKIGSKTRFLQAPPRASPFVEPAVVANPFVERLSIAVLGDGAFCNLYSSNTNCPGSSDQPVHVDAGQLWPGLREGHPAATLSIDIPLRDITEELGPIEIWPGTHLETDIRFLVAPQDLARHGARGVVACTRLGDVIVRDLRTWHRGWANRSGSIRHMLTMYHNCFWLERGPRIRFAKGCEEAFTGSAVRWHCEFVDAQPGDRHDPSLPSTKATEEGSKAINCSG